jgi:hypothetical protein
MKFPKLFEEAVHVFRKDSLSCINDMHFEHLFGFVKGHYHADYTTPTKLEGILHQVYKNLFESDFVSD